MPGPRRVRSAGRLPASKPSFSSARSTNAPTCTPSARGWCQSARRLRTIEDALALRAELASGHEHVLVIGGGFIGGEVGSTARRLGRKVTLVDSSPYPMHAGLGVVPNSDWLDGSGLSVDDGVLCEPTLGATDIVAAGDVARWRHGLYDNGFVRVEHWSNANEQGAVAARNLLAGPENARPFAEVPNFATHVHGARIQTAGLPHLADEASIIAGNPDEDRFAVSFTRNGVPMGAVAVNLPKELIRLKRAIMERQAS